MQSQSVIEKPGQSGGAAAAVNASRDGPKMDHFEASVLSSLRDVHNHLHEKGLSGDQKHLESADFSAFLRAMADASANIVLPAPLSSLDQPLSAYFISASHNTYLTGHQLYGSATVDGYKTVLLQGCRCVEIDCWDGEAASNSQQGKGSAAADGKLSEPQPVVLHGHTATREVSFRHVCETIRDYAFVATPLPLIVSLEVHTSHAQQEIMVKIMNECFKGLLCSAAEQSDAEHGPSLPTVNQLKNKILVKVKYSPPQSTDSTAASSSIARLQPSDADSVSELSVPPDDGKHTKSKIIDALSKMATYVRGYHFSNFRQPEAKVPCHVFSLSESALLGIYKADPEALFAHNKEYLMRAYPKGTRIASSNLDPSQFWRLGVQMVALNWQRVDKGMMLQHAMFSDTGGWVQKPDGLASSAQYEAPAKEGGSSAKSWLSLTILAGQCLPLPPTLDNEDKLRPYIKCEVHIDTPPEESDEERKSKRKDNGLKKLTGHAKGSNPKFGDGARLFFEGLPTLTPALSFLRLKIMHDKIGPDELSSWACIRLDRLARGIRFIHLMDVKGSLTTGALLADVDYAWNVPPKSVAVRS